MKLGGALKMVDQGQVHSWLQNKGIHAKEEWLRACLQWLQSEDVGLLCASRT